MSQYEYRFLTQFDGAATDKAVNELARLGWVVSGMSSCVDETGIYVTVQMSRVYVRYQVMIKDTPKGFIFDQNVDHPDVKWASIVQHVCETFDFKIAQGGISVDPVNRSAAFTIQGGNSYVRVMRVNA